jgi:hypothetical protein
MSLYENFYLRLSCNFKKLLTMQKIYFLFLACMLTNASSYSQPSAQWIKTYDDPINGIDKAYAIALDNGCNLYVTGQSDSITTGADYLTIKYDYIGNVIWKVRYNGSANGDDIPSAIKVDNSGNVYVTGKSQGTNWDYATVKYDANGVQQWVQRFNNTNPGGNGDDAASDLALSPTGNAVYVTGYSHNYILSTSNDNWVTIAYTSAGVQQWIKGYSFGTTADRVFKIIVSSAGIIYVLGLKDYYPFVRSYDATGTAIHDFNGCGGTVNNVPIGILLDGSNNVYMLDHGTNVPNDQYIYLVKNNQNGFNVWCKLFNGYIPTDFKMDASGNFYISGYTASTDHDMLVMKCDANGDTVWTKTFNGAASGDDRAIAISLDNTSSHHILVTGYQTNASGNKDIVVMKLNNTTGATMWQSQYDRGCTSDEEPFAMQMDGYNNVYLTGYSYCNSSLEDFITAKYVVNTVNASAIANQTTICNGDTAALSASDGSSYQWFSGTNLLGTSQTIQVSPSTVTTYDVIVSQYCWSDTDSVTINVNPNPPPPTIIYSQNILQSSSASTYQWYLNGTIINGAIFQTFLLSQSGNYSVVITDTNGCSAMSSITVGIPETKTEKLISVFPNPANENTFIVGQLQSGTSITITNVLAENVFKTILVQKEEKVEIDTHNFGQGIYFVEINMEGRKYIQKLIIN